jgi:hypothetical protein
MVTAVSWDHHQQNCQGLVNALIVHVDLVKKHFSGNPTYQVLTRKSQAEPLFYRSNILARVSFRLV